MTTPPTDDYQAIATRVILALTGRRWTWPLRQVLEEYNVPDTTDTIHLSGRPVRLILSVTNRDGTVDYTDSAEPSDGFKLRIPQLSVIPWPYGPQLPAIDMNGGIWPRMSPQLTRFIRVSYVYGSPPPADIQRAINELATELQAAATGGDCKLPTRVTNISREGISFTILDPMQFLEGGKTGLYYTDLIISAYGSKTKARARVWTPEHRPPRRLSSIEYVPDNASETSSGLTTSTDLTTYGG